ncbi:MAG TPA: nuclear transport factor 2 family protein [Gaiellaceae bacterium]|nr:nuclear transport factor 2 family protein [Gaiellaceae bacterium]
MVTVTRSPALEEWAREARRRFESGDQAWFEQTTAHGEVSSFGTAPDEQLRGREAVLAMLDGMHATSDVADPGAAATGNEDEEQVEAYEAGDAGWIVTHGRFTFADGSWVPNRVVNVVLRDPDGGGWTSVLVASQLLVPDELLDADSPLRRRSGLTQPG